MPERFTENGAFTAEFARQRRDQRTWRLDRGLVRELRRLINGRTAFDFGAGIGLYCAELNCCGVDGIPGIENLSAGRVHWGDLTSTELRLPEHEVALCLEVAEHIPPQRQSIFLDHLTRSCQLLVLSWGGRGQAGVGHVNCLDEPDVRALMEQRGFRVVAAEVHRLRKAASISWFRKNLLVFERRTEAPQASTFPVGNTRPGG
ncbi:hypothetical protein [Planctomicrobium sp. SH664]|uniref:hypothetical protein n=1 Tax=Planctomicrobium sp. SH664 TaxID=3448125 RepID=UPI003F5C006C